MLSELDIHPDELATTERYQLLMQKLEESPYIPITPTAKQWGFILDERREILYGGAAGGGKSIALLAAALLHVDVPSYRALVLRRTFQDLILPGALMDIADQWLRPTDAKRKQVGREWHFPSGAVLTFGYMANEGQKYRYQGAAFNFVGWDETTQFSEAQYTYLFSRCRHAVGQKDNVPDRIRCCCVDEGDVLTETGWKRIQDVRVGELVYSTNAAGELELKPVLNVFEGDGETLLKVNQRGLKMSITPDHRVVATRLNQRRGTKRFELIPFAEDTGTSIKITRSPQSLIAKGWDAAPLGLGTDTYLSFLGIFLAEGCTVSKPVRGNYRVTVSQEKHADKVKTLFDKLGRNYYHGNGDFTLCSLDWWSHFRQFGKAHEKFIPRDILNNGNFEQLALLYKWMMLGDGSTDGYSYTTVSPQLADDMMELAFKLGFGVKRRRDWDANAHHRERHTLNFSGKMGQSKYTVVEKNDKRNDVVEVPYTGKVYCIQVADNETFVIRQGDTVWLSGNSNPGGIGHDWVKSRFIDALPPEKEAARLFIPATLRDNPYLDVNAYQEMLNELDPVTRAQLENGNWDIRPSGNFFLPKIRAVALHESNGNWKRAQRCRAWDLAATETGDYAVGLLLARDRNARLWRVEDVVRVRAEPAKLEKVLMETAARDGHLIPQVIEQETGSAGKFAMRDLRTRIFQGSPVFPMPTTGNKLTRARLAASIVAAGDMEMAPAGWNSDFLSELIGFGGEQDHDDQVDALAYATHWLVKQGGADKPRTTLNQSQDEVVTKPKRLQQSRLRIIR
jgi:predicted phage terminase large subunit-like protein